MKIGTNVYENDLIEFILPLENIEVFKKLIRIKQIWLI